MRLEELGRFHVLHRRLPWPWIAFNASGTRIAFAESESRIATRGIERGGVVTASSFELPADFALTDADAPRLQGMSLDLTGQRLAVFAEDTLLTMSPSEVVCQSAASDLDGPGLRLRAASFDRTGTRLWISADGERESALIVVDAETHAVIAKLRSAPFTAPSLHELYTHPQDDAVLLLVACGEEGTFARVAGWSDGPVEAIATALDGGGISAGFVGFAASGAHLHLAEADELRTHAWPGLQELSSVELADDFVSSYSGVVLGDRIFVDGQEADTGDDAVMQFDRSAIRGTLLNPPFPTGMWAGRLGTDCIVTVEAKGDPAEARILRLPLPTS